MKTEAEQILGSTNEASIDWETVMGHFSMIGASNLSQLIAKDELRNMAVYSLAIEGMDKSGKWIGFPKAEAWAKKEIGDNYDRLVKINQEL